MRKFVMAASALALMVPGMALAADVPATGNFQVQLTIQDAPPPPDRVVTITGLESFVDAGTIQKDANFRGNGQQIFKVGNSFCAAVNEGAVTTYFVSMTLSQSNYVTPIYENGGQFVLKQNGAIPYAIPLDVNFVQNGSAQYVARDFNYNLPLSASCDADLTYSAGNAAFTGFTFTATNSIGGNNAPQIAAGVYVADLLLTVSPG